MSFAVQRMQKVESMVGKPPPAVEISTSSCRSGFTPRFDYQLPTKSSAGFTLVELMVSISVMIILAGILFTAFNQNQNAPRLETAQMMLSQAFTNARSQAILKQNRARLIIHSDASKLSNEEEANKYLRYFGVVVETKPDSDQWETALKGEYLPEGVYFIPEPSVETIAWDQSRPTSRQNGQSMILVFPSLKPESAGPGSKWSFFEFKSTGRMSGLTNKVVVAQGNLRDLKPEFPEPTSLLGLTFNSYGLQFPIDEEAAL